MTFVELLVVMAVMTVAVTMFTSMVVHTSRQRGINRENALAANAARTQLELMRNEEFSELFALYNADSKDDPQGAGTAPGAYFAVDGLTLLPDDADGFVGEILLPVVVTTTEAEEAEWGRSESDAAAAAGGMSGGLGFGGGGGGGGGEGAGEVYYSLREDYEDDRLGMPRDLNGDSLIDDMDHSQDYLVLPVLIRIQWRGDFGPRTYDLYSQITTFLEAPE